MLYQFNLDLTNGQKRTPFSGTEQMTYDQGPWLKIICLLGCVTGDFTLSLSLLKKWPQRQITSLGLAVLRLQRGLLTSDLSRSFSFSWCFQSSKGNKHIQMNKPMYVCVCVYVCMSVRLCVWTKRVEGNIGQPTWPFSLKFEHNVTRITWLMNNMLALLYRLYFSEGKGNKNR